jgi:tetratricopeptide (TPR) repeat protein
VLFQQGLALNPDLALLVLDDFNTHQSLGHGEAARQGLIRAIGLMRRSDHGSMTSRASAVSLPAMQALLDEALGDYLGALKEIDETLALPSFFGSREKAVSWRAQDLALDHDVIAARRAMPAGADDAALSRALLKWGGASTPHFALDMVLDDWAGVLGELRGVGSLVAEAEQQVAGKQSSYLVRSQVWPREAEALAHLGRIGEAQALIARTPLDGYDAVRIRGVVAALAGSPAEADRWFADAIRQAPSLPLAHLDWARAKLARGDAHGAIAEAAVAHAKGPRYADPLELWGEALMAKGEFAAAAGKFREADRWAPAWGRNHLRWGEALWRAGDLDDARKQFAAANGDGLSLADRAALDVFLQRAAPAAPQG